MVRSASAAAVVLMRLLVRVPSATTSTSTLISRCSSSSSSSIGFRPLLYSSNFSSAAATTSVKMLLGDSSSSLYTFGPYQIDPKEVFYSTTLSYAMVNLRPLVPGHVLVCPRREVKRFVDLTDVETSDLWLTAKKVGGQLECFHKATSLTYAIQDGPQAGQTVPHVHIHILPRKVGDFEKNDEIYDAIDEAEKEMKQKLDLDKERKDRSPEEMAQEADEYRSLFMSVYRESNES